MLTPIPALTSLRFFAALFVVVSHFGFLAKTQSAPVRWIATNVFAEGYIGVTFFFILSGFILAESYDRRFSTGAVTIKAFYVARVARVMPLHLLTLACSLPILLIGTSQTVDSRFVARFLANAPLLQSFVPDPGWYFSFNSPSWSLSVEALFYLAFPVLIVLRNGTLLTLAAAIIAIKIALGMLPTADDHHFLQYIFPPLRVADFAIGIALNRAFRQFSGQTAPYASCLQAGAIVSLLAFGVAGAIMPQWTRFDLWYMAPMGAIIYAFAHSDGRFAGAISGRGMILLGEASFALYLIHQLVIRYGERLFSHYGIVRAASDDLMIAAVYLGVSLVAAICVFLLFETRAKGWVLERLRPIRVGPASQKNA